MKCVLVKIAFSPNEQMLEETAEMLTELENVINFHGVIRLVKVIDIPGEISAVSLPAEPCGHEGGLPDDKVSNDRADNIIEDRKSPLDKCIASFFSGLLVFVFFMINVILLTFIVEMTMN